VGLADVEFGYGGAAQRFEMGAEAETLAHFVRDRAHVGSGGDAGAEVGTVGLDGGDGEFLDLDLNRLQNDFLPLARQLVGGDAIDFLGRERRRDLLDEAEECGGEGLQLFEAGVGGADLAHGFAIGIVSVGGEAEADHAFVVFLGSGVELRQAREVADDEREHAGGERIERAQMADGALLENPAHAVNHVVGSPTGGFVDDENAIHSEANSFVIVRSGNFGFRQAVGLFA